MADVPAPDPVDVEASRHVHLVGIGGAAMNPLATILLQSGLEVSGSDLTDSPTTQSLRQLGARISLGHQAENVGDADLVVISSAVPDTNAEVVEARRRGVRVIKHSAALGSLMRRRRGIAIAGTHGKTTTSALTAVALDTAGLDPMFHVGSEILGYGAFGRRGSSDLLVAEADEYDRRFLDYEPEIAVITSVEPDHLDYFGSFDAVRQAFVDFLARVRPGGLVLLCADDPIAHNLAPGDGRRLTYGFDPSADWCVLSWEPRDSVSSVFRLREPGGAILELAVNLLGKHNVTNAAAVVALCSWLGLPMARIREGLAAFRGTRRRFERLGEAHGVSVVDDYAHHPTAVRVTLEAARAHHAAGIWAIFQPHTAHRTTSLLDEFSSCFAAADHVVITPTYRPAGRETEGDDPSIAMLLERMDHADVRTLPPHEAARWVGATAQPGDLVLVMGAGDIWEIGPEILHHLEGAGVTP